MTNQDIANPTIREYFAKHNLNLLLKDEERPWGGWYVYETGDNYDKKVMWVKPRNLLSLQYHGTTEHPSHAEQWTAITTMCVALGNKPVVGLSAAELAVELANVRVITIQPGDKIDIPAGYLHALCNPYDTDLYMLETRTSPSREDSNSRENNIVRIYDQAQRGGVPQFPPELYNRIFNL